MNRSTGDYPPNLGLGELPWLRREHKTLRVKVGADMFISWENSNNPEWGEYYICVTAGGGGRISQLDIDIFVPDVLTLKCWVLAKMEEYDVEAPRTSIGVSE